MGHATKLAPGLCYSLSNVAEESLSFSVQAQCCAGAANDGVRLRLLPGGGYLRILDDGRADQKGGGGGLCNFSLEVQDSGLLKLSRGQYSLSAAAGTLAAKSGAEQLSAAELWAVEEAPAPEGSPPVKAVFLRQGAMRFGPFVREDVKEGVIRLQVADSRYLRIVPQNGMVDAVGGGGPPCQFRIHTSDGSNFTLTSEHEPFRCLGINPWGALSGRDSDDGTRAFLMEAVEYALGTPMPPPVLAGKVDFDENIDLTSEQRESFIKDGFFIVKGAVPRALATAALAEINHALLKPGAATQQEDGGIRHCSEAAGSDKILALLYGTPLWTLAQRLMGRGRTAKLQQGQIALRPPNLDAVGINDSDLLPLMQWHIDGMIEREAQFSSFSVLVGVALSDQLQPNCGNLIAFAGSHHALQPMVRQEVETPGSYPFLGNKGDNGGKPELRNGQQILLDIGDAVVLHQKVAHRVGINCSPNIRYQTYFRLKHVDHASHLADGSLHQGLWRQFDGLEEHCTPP